jgi:site-specific DNA-methyltransferase (adenine-specific)
MSYMETATRSESPEWPTPQWLVDQLAAEFGPFDTDPAATRSNAKAPRFYTIEDDGLTQPWPGRVWLNPPYGRTIAAWMAKARDEVADGNADRVVCLVPARVDTKWWRDSTRSASLVRIWPGRIVWTENGQPAPFPSAIIVLGTLPGRHGTEPRWCQVCKAVFWPAYTARKTCSDRCRKAEYRNRTSPGMSQIQGRKRGQEKGYPKPMTTEQYEAYKAVRRALRTGELVRPVNCEQCGETEIVGSHAHHPNGYSPEHALDVIWLCRLCHNRAHSTQLAEARRRRRAKTPPLPPRPDPVRTDPVQIELWSA